MRGKDENDPENPWPKLQTFGRPYMHLYLVFKVPCSRMILHYQSSRLRTIVVDPAMLPFLHFHCFHIARIPEAKSNNVFDP